MHEPGLINETEHHLRFEMWFSVLREDERGRPLSGSAQGAELREGTIRRVWVDRNVYVMDCNASPLNIIVPNYTSSTTVDEDAEARRASASKSISTAFKIPRHSKQKALGKPDRDERAGGSVLEHVEKHRAETDGLCMCFAMKRNWQKSWDRSTRPSGRQTLQRTLQRRERAPMRLRDAGPTAVMEGKRRKFRVYVIRPL